MNIISSTQNITSNNPDFNLIVRKLYLVLGQKKIFTNLNVNFQGPGMIFIEGENGSGKSSLLKVLAGFTKYTSGEILIGTKPIHFKKREFSFLNTTSLGLLNDFTGREHIQMLNSSIEFNEDELQKEILRFQELEIFNEVLNIKVSEMSQGMKQILRLFLHLYFRPKYLFLDEPFLYLSPKVRSFFEGLISDLSKNSLIFVTDQKTISIKAEHSHRISLGNK